MVTPIEQRYIDLHPGSAELYATAKGLFPDGVTHDGRRLNPFPIYATHGLRARKWDVDGNQLIDFWTGHGSMILGHAHPDIVETVTEQISKGTHLSASSELEIRWAQWVQELIPCAEKVRFHSSGTEANMMALRMARAYTGKSKVVKFGNHFHGWHDYAMAGEQGIGGIPEETLNTMIVLQPNDIAKVESVLKEDNDIAAVILEPTGGHMGEDPITPAFLGEIREVTERYGIVLIFDEVVTGFRISKNGAQGLYGIIPDMTTLAKILGGGLPGGAVCGKADIINMIEVSDGTETGEDRRIGHWGTFNANPLTASAGIKALELVATTPINDTANAMADRLKNGLNDLLSQMEIPGCVSGIASLAFLRLGVDHECDKEICILSPDQTAIASDPARMSQLNLSLINNGVHSAHRFILGSAHTEQDIDETVNVFEKAFTEIRGLGLI